MNEKSEAQDTAPEKSNEGLSEKFDLGDLDDNFDLFEDEEDDDYFGSQNTSQELSEAGKNSSLQKLASSVPKKNNNNPFDELVDSDPSPTTNFDADDDSDDPVDPFESMGDLGSMDDLGPTDIPTPLDDSTDDDDMDELGGNLWGEDQTQVGNWDEDQTQVVEDQGGQDKPNAALVDQSGKVYNIHHFPFTIGRSKECDLVLGGKGISRQHAEIEFTAGEFRIRDLKSLNGTKVNGQSVPHSTVTSDDEIKLGNIVLKFRLENDSLYGQAPQSKDYGRTNGLIQPHKDFAIKDPIDYGDHPQTKTGTDSMGFLLRLNFILIALVFIFGGVYMVLNFDNKKNTTYDPYEAYDEPIEVHNEPDPIPMSGRVVDRNSLGDKEVGSDGVGREYQRKNTYLNEGVDPNARIERYPVQETDGGFEASGAYTDKMELDRFERLKEIERQKRELDSLYEVRKKMEQENEERLREQEKIKAQAAKDRANTQAREVLFSAEEKYQNSIKGMPELLKKMETHANNQKVDQSLREQLLSKRGVYANLFGRYQKGLKAYEAGNSTLAFEEWSSFMAKEKEVLGANNSAFSKQVTNKVVETLKSEAKLDEANAFYHNSYKKWQKVIELTNDPEAIEAVRVFNEQAETLYVRAVQIERNNPSEAIELWEEVIELVPPEHDYHTRASAKLAWIKEWGGYRVSPQ